MHMADPNLLPEWDSVLHLRWPAMLDGGTSRVKKIIKPLIILVVQLVDFRVYLCSVTVRDSHSMMATRQATQS